jgi:hypothetical protein
VGIVYPGICFDVPESDYRQEKATNYSLVKQCLKQYKTPRHYWAHCLDPERPAKYKAERIPGQPMINGSATHVLIGQPELFDQQFFLTPTSDKRTKKWAASLEKNPGKTPIKPEDWDKIHYMAESVKAHAGAVYLLSEGVAEVPVFWMDGDEKCKGLLDWLRPDHHIVDIKTSFDASLTRYGFDYIVRKKAFYSWQLAHYCNGYEAATGVFPAFTFVTVENLYPYYTHVISYSPENMSRFRDEFRLELDKFFEAKRNNWPGYSNLIEVI